MPLATSPFWTPLDRILGSRASVATIRVLVRHKGLLSVSRLADEAGLSRQSVYSVLQNLAGSGLVNVEGAAHSLFSYNDLHPMAAAIDQLFAAERKQTTTFFETIREWASASRPAPKSVWLFGSVARRADHKLSDVDIAVVGDADNVRQQGDDLRELLATQTANSMVRPSIITLSTVELQDLPVTNEELWQHLVREAVSIFGAPPPSDLDD
jgi:predicted nucleotidyltransferase